MNPTDDTQTPTEPETILALTVAEREAYDGAIGTYQVASDLRDEIPDGMWPDMKQCARTWTTSPKTDGDRRQFTADLTKVCAEWGF